MSEKNLGLWNTVVVLIDDVRCFDPEVGGDAYPSRDYLVAWASRNKMAWQIEHDIFIARRVR